MASCNMRPLKSNISWKWPNIARWSNNIESNLCTIHHHMCGGHDAIKISNIFDVVVVVVVRNTNTLVGTYATD